MSFRAQRNAALGALWQMFDLYLVESPAAKCKRFLLNLGNTSDSSNVHHYIVASCYNCVGLCLEKLPTVAVSRFRQAEREQLIIRCFELSGDISLLQLQERQVLLVVLLPLGPCGAWGHCRISPPCCLAECRKRRLNQGSFDSAVSLVVYFLWFVLCLCVYFCDLYWLFSLSFVCQ